MEAGFVLKYRAISENHLYSKAYTKGKKCVAKRVVVYVLKDLRAEALKRANPEKKKINRVGITVTKKMGGAVVRNRVKRILRDGYRAVDTKYGVKKGYLIVIVARNFAVTAKSGDIAADLKYSFKTLDMLELCRTRNGSACGSDNGNQVTR